VSIDRCSRCGDFVDTDNEPEAYVEIGNMRAQTETVCLCRHHREEHEEELERQADQASRGEAMAERQFSPAQQAIIDAHEAENSEGDPIP
jgi:hypothetical protein